MDPEQKAHMREMQEAQVRDWEKRILEYEKLVSIVSEYYPAKAEEFQGLIEQDKSLIGWVRGKQSS